MTVAFARRAASWLEWRAFAVRHAVAWRWRKHRGRSGEFVDPEDSARARELAAAWETAWPNEEPLMYRLRADAERRVRFHTLPEGQRYAQTEADAAEVLRRQWTILDELRGDADLESIVIVAVEWSARDLSSGMSRAALPNSWPWRIRRDGSGDDDPPAYFWAQVGIDRAGLDRVFESSSNDRGTFTISGKDMTWLMCPYDGGVDVVSPSSTASELAAARYSEWLPD